MTHTRCPFCGCTRLMLTENTKGILERVEFWVRCTMCASEGPTHKTAATAIAAWDKRVLDLNAMSQRDAVIEPELR